jgi:putative transposase
MARVLELDARPEDQRAAVKAAELGVSVRTVHARRTRYAEQGLWGLVDQRAVREWAATGRADVRLVAAIGEVVEAETSTSTGTRSRLIRRVTKKLEAEHGAGVVPLPSRSAFYQLIDALSVGRHTFGSAVTRRQTANRPQGVFTPSFAARPGEQVQIDSTPIDVLVAGEIAGSGRGGNRVEQVGLTVQQTGRPYSASLRWTMAS